MPLNTTSTCCGVKPVSARNACADASEFAITRVTPSRAQYLIAFNCLPPKWSVLTMSRRCQTTGLRASRPASAATTIARWVFA